MLAISMLALSACTTTPPASGELAELKQILGACETNRPPGTLVLLDGTGSNNSVDITEERMDAVESIVRETAVCSGKLRVVLFSSSSASTITLFDDSLVLEGVTDNSRLKKMSPLVEDVMSQIKKAYEPAIASLPQGGSDIPAMYRLASEWIAQVGDPFKLQLRIFTDGVVNVGVDLGARVLTKQEATAIANSFEVPELPGASVVVAGLGRVAGPPLPSALVEGLVVFYSTLCEAAGAARCVSVTDYAVGR